MAIPSLATSTLPALDQLRGLRGQLGYAPIAVTVRVVTTAAGAPGQGGPPTIVDTPLYVATSTPTGEGGVDNDAPVTFGPQNPRVVQVSDRDALASNGLYTNQEMKVGPLTPEFMATLAWESGGVAASTLDPPVAPGAGSKEIFFKLSGGGYQQPVWFKRIGDSVEHSTRYFVILKRSGNQNPGGIP